MEKTLIIVSSITYAIRGRDILTSNGYRAYIANTPGHLDKMGCSYSIAVTGNADLAEKILRENGIKVLGRIEQK